MTTFRTPAPKRNVGLSKNRTSPVELFRQLLHRECDLVAEEGLTVIPYESQDLVHFNRLSPEKQKGVIQQASETVAVYEEMRAQTLSLRDNSQLLWHCMGRLGLIPPGDLFDKITVEDIVVIFAPDQRQIFRNLEFLRHSVLTLEELYATEWYRYTRRDMGIVQKIQKTASDLKNGLKTGTFDPEIEEHVIEQVSSYGPAKLRIKINYVSPVTSAGNIAGIVVVERGWPVKD